MVDIRLPQLAEGADSGTVVSILVSEGDQVKKDQTILEIENEKATAPIPSTDAGVVQKIHVKEGDTVTAGQVIISLGGDGESKEEPEPQPSKAKEPEPIPEPQRRVVQSDQEYTVPTVNDPILNYTYTSKSGFPPPASPTVRKVARDIGLDLTKIRGSERGGRIIMDDIKKYIQRLQEIAFSKMESGQAQPSSPPPQSIDFSQWGPVNKQPYSSIRKTIGRRMHESWSTIPHVYQFDEADISPLMTLRKEFKEVYKEKGANLTLTAFAVKVVTNALKKFPIFNASLEEANEEVVYKEYHHIGIAVDTEAGLLVPVIQNVEKKSLFDISKELGEIAEKARNRKLTNEEMKGSSFTISNLGGIGGTHFTPIVNKPNVAILGMGRGVNRPTVVDGKIEPRTILPLCVSYDHRVIDGADGARFITEVVAGFESFPKDQVKL